MSDNQKKNYAIKLRSSGLSLLEISKKVSVSKSTASIWCRDVNLTKKQKEFLKRQNIMAGERGRLMGANSNRKKKELAIDEARLWSKKIFETCSKREFLMAGIALYWAEGSKKNGSGFSFVNSDPKMINLMIIWLKEFMDIEKEYLMPRISINESHEPRIDKVLKFWSKLIGLPSQSFGNPVFIRVHNKKIYENHDSYYGIMRLRVKRSGHLLYRMLSLIEELGKVNKPV